MLIQIISAHSRARGLAVPWQRELSSCHEEECSRTAAVQLSYPYPYAVWSSTDPLVWQRHFLIQENVRSPSPWLAIGSSVSHNVVFILGRVQGEILLAVVYFWVKGRGVKKGKYVLF